MRTTSSGRCTLEGPSVRAAGSEVPALGSDNGLCSCGPASHCNATYRQTTLPIRRPQAGPDRAAPGAAVTPHRRLRHPGPQHDVQVLRNQHLLPPVPQPMERPDAQAQRVVTVLLRELDAARKQGAAAQAELAALKDQVVTAALGHEPRLGTARATGSPASQVGRKPAAASADGGSNTRRVAAGAAPTRIAAFRPPVPAPTPRQQQHSKHSVARPEASPNSTRAAPRAPASAAEVAAGGGPEQHGRQPSKVEALQRGNAEMRAHLEALYAHCRHLQRQLDARSGGAQSSASDSSQAPPLAAEVRPRAAAVAAAEGSPRRRPLSPSCTTVVVTSPRAGGDLAVAVFEVGAAWLGCATPALLPSCPPALLPCCPAALPLAGNVAGGCWMFWLVAVRQGGFLSGGAQHAQI